MTDLSANGLPLGKAIATDLLLPFHFESNIDVNAAAADIFTLLDDHSRLSAHMTKPSWMMAGSAMTLEFDAANGRAVGAKISLHGNVLGIPLSVEEIFTERNPPLRKVWSTIGKPQLVVIGPYRMGFVITPRNQTSHLRVFIDYALPDGHDSYWLGRLFGIPTLTGAPNAATHFKERFDD